MLRYFVIQLLPHMLTLLLWRLSIRRCHYFHIITIAAYIFTPLRVAIAGDVASGASTAAHMRVTAPCR